MASATTEHVLSLYQEIAALLRAGVPLDSGLRAFASDLPGNAGRLAKELATRLEQGQPLHQAIAEIDPQQRVYAAVLAVGMKSGKPAEALESLVATATRYQRLRRSLGAEFIYPLFLLLLGYGLWEFALRNLVPVGAAMSEKFDAPNPVVQLLQSTPQWLTAAGNLSLLFIVLVVAMLLWFLRKATSLQADPGKRLHLFARLRAAHAHARFLDMLALLVEQAVPLPDAVTLAGEASQWQALALAAKQVGEQLRRGERPRAESPIPAPTLWLLTGDRAARHLSLLRREAEHYRRQTDRLSRWMVTWLPLGATLVIGIGYVVLLAFVNLGPFLNLMLRLSRPDNG
jgi:general secretion pathway protein F